MTTINNDAVNTDTNAVEAAAPARVTLKSSLEAHDVNALAAVLAKMASDKECIQKFGRTFSGAVQQAKEILKENEKQAAQNALDAVQRREDKKAERLAAIAKADAAIQAEKENMIKFLMDTVNGLGLDLDAAEVAAQAAIEKKHGTGEKAKKYTFTRIAVVVDGKDYMMPTSGNMVQVLKDAMTNGGYATHKDFILAHAKDINEANEAFGIETDSAE